MKTIKKVKVGNMVSMKTGRAVPNQFVITTENGRYYQSYETMIAFIPNDFDSMINRIVLDPAWQYSRTTSKYRRKFLNETTKETKQKIEAGVYEIKCLN